MNVIRSLALIVGTSALYAGVAMSAAMALAYSRAMSLVQAGIFCAGAAATVVLAQAKAPFTFGLVGVLLVAFMAALAIFLSLKYLPGPSHSLRGTLAGLGLAVYVGGAAATSVAVLGINVLTWPGLHNSWFSAAAPASYRTVVYAGEALLLPILAYGAYRNLARWAQLDTRARGIIAVFIIAAALSALSGALLVTRLSEVNPTADIILVGLIATAFSRHPLIAGGIGFLVGLGDFAASYLAPPALREIVPATLFISIVVVQTWRTRATAARGDEARIAAPAAYSIGQTGVHGLVGIIGSIALLAILPLHLSWPESMTIVELAISAAGIQLLYMTTGRLNLMPAAFVMIGSYAIVLGPMVSASPGVSLLAGFAAAAALATLIGLAVQHSRPETFAVFTLVVGVLAGQVITAAGPGGMPLEMIAPEPDFLASLPLLSALEPLAALYVLGSALLVTALIVGFILSAAMRRPAHAGAAPREAASRSVFVVCFVASALCSAAAGALVAWHMILVPTFLLDFRATLDTLAAALLGGIASPAGAILGAIVIEQLHELNTGYMLQNNYNSLGPIEMISGALITGTAVLAPGGIIPVVVAGAGTLGRGAVRGVFAIALRARKAAAAFKMRFTPVPGKARPVEARPAEFSEIVTLDTILRIKYALNLVLNVARAGLCAVAAWLGIGFMFGGVLRMVGMGIFGLVGGLNGPLLLFLPLFFFALMACWAALFFLGLWLIERVNRDSMPALLLALGLCIVATWTGASNDIALVLVTGQFFFAVLAVYALFLLHARRTSMGAALREPAPLRLPRVSRTSAVRLISGLAAPIGRLLAHCIVASALWMLATPLDFIVPGFGACMLVGIFIANRRRVANGVREDFRLMVAQARRTAGQILAADRRRPILFLRSFSDDYVDTVDVTARVASVVFGGDYHRLRLEECIVSSIGRKGPVIAIARPGSPPIDLGAARDALLEGEWQDVVAKYMDEAQLIVMVYGATKGLLWEVEQIARRGYRRKFILVNPRPGSVSACDLIALFKGKPEVQDMPTGVWLSNIIAVMENPKTGAPVLVGSDKHADSIAYRAALRYCMDARRGES